MICGLGRPQDYKRPYGTTLLTWVRGKPMTWDVTVPDTYAESHNVSYFDTLDCKAVATCRIPDTYKPKPNPYLNTNPNPTSILCKDSRKDFTLHTV